MSGKEEGGWVGWKKGEGEVSNGARWDVAIRMRGMGLRCEEGRFGRWRRRGR